MEKNDSKKKINVNTIVICVAIVLLVVVFILFASPKQENGTTPDGAAGTTIIPDEEMELTDIETPYGVLKFPAARYDNLKLTEKEENGVYCQTYYCVINGVELELYTVCFGEIDGITRFGYVRKEEGQVPFGISFCDVIKPESWTEDEYYIAKVMLEDVNYIIDSVMARDDFMKEK